MWGKYTIANLPFRQLYFSPTGEYTVGEIPNWRTYREPLCDTSIILLSLVIFILSEQILKFQGEKARLLYFRITEVR
jgi:hypothetical protein